MEHTIITLAVEEILDKLAAACGGHSQYNLAAIEAAMAGHLAQGDLVRPAYTANRVKNAIIALEKERWEGCPEAMEWIDSLQRLRIVDQYNKPEPEWEQIGRAHV